ILTPPTRVLLVAAANFAALRLEQLAGPDPDRLGARGRLTARELAVLRLLSTGAQSRQVAQSLSIGEETVRSHLKKAQAKLGVPTRGHAVAEALRQQLIPRDIRLASRLAGSPGVGRLERSGPRWASILRGIPSAFCRHKMAPSAYVTPR